jgi:hypothetical protein
VTHPHCRARYSESHEHPALCSHQSTGRLRQTMKTNGLYVNQRDRFDDMPLAQIVANFNTVYGDWMADQNPLSQARFTQDVEAEK